MFNLSGKRIFVAGHRGMVGRALVRRLASESCEVLVAPREELDLMRQADVEDWFAHHRPDAVIMAAAKVGGIMANATQPTEFLLNNLLIETNTINAAFKTNVEKFLLLGSSCIYPKFAPQPIAESALLTSALEPTNEAYAIAKIAGLKLCEAMFNQYGRAFISAMPCNLYGPYDNFDLNSSHVIPALIRKIHDAKAAKAPTVTLWGTGTPLREFMLVDDLADGLVFALQHYHDPLPINLGSGNEVTIRELAEMICKIVGYDGELVFDTTKPDGTPRKLLDNARIQALGWRARTPLDKGLEITYKWWQEEVPHD